MSSWRVARFSPCLTSPLDTMLSSSGQEFIGVLAGRLGTWHELYDLLNRLKHALLPRCPFTSSS